MGMSIVIEEAYLPATLTALPMTDEEFLEFCAQFPDYFIEMSGEGEILIMPPSDYLTSARISKMLQQLINWSDANRRGWVNESSGGFVLPNGARLAPDVAWFPNDKPRLADTGTRSRFPHFAPDFVIELRSPVSEKRSDRLSRLRSKMHEWTGNGTSLAWLVDPERRVIEIYRPGVETQTLLNPDTVAGEGPVEGFVLDLRPVWDPSGR
jgi:Uma2 family endonuclease